MIFGILSITAAILSIIVGGRFTYKYYMTDHAKRRFIERCKKNIAPYMRNGKWGSFVDTAGNRHNLCYTQKGTADFVTRGNQITTVMSNTDGYSLDKLSDTQIRCRFNIPFTCDPEFHKPANHRRNVRTHVSSKYTSDNP